MPSRELIESSRVDPFGAFLRDSTFRFRPRGIRSPWWKPKSDADRANFRQELVQWPYLPIEEAFSILFATEQEEAAALWDESLLRYNQF